MNDRAVVVFCQLLLVLLPVLTDGAATPDLRRQRNLATNLTIIPYDDDESDEGVEDPIILQTPASTLSFDFDLFPRCNLTTQDMVQLTLDEVVDPCIIFDILPPPQTSSLNTSTSVSSTLITLVQVTPATHCWDARDGATTSVELLNGLNDGRGMAIGFHQDHYVQFRLVSLIAGNMDQMGTEAYGPQHSAVLSAALDSLQAGYIVGTCSLAAAFEREPAHVHQTMLLAQVGPPAFYKATPNPYLFGVHINSDEYPIPTIKALGFRGGATQQQPVRVLYRRQPEFFSSTCQSALRTLKEYGFEDIVEVSYDPEEDDDQDGELNHFDEEWIRARADEICPPNNNGTAPPAIFACVRNEQDILLQRWKENECRPSSLWMTPATFRWAYENAKVVPYLQGGGQWHSAMTYGDRFFHTGKELLEYNEGKFGYSGSYNMVVSYAILMVFAEHLESYYRVVDVPKVQEDFRNNYEGLRRSMIVLSTDTIFGPLAFDDNQQNNGRGAAGTQWQPSGDNDEGFENVLVSPFLQAQAEVLIPAPSAQDCPPGQYINATKITTDSAILASKCDQCPVNTFTVEPNQQLVCTACPEGSSTRFAVGQSYCVSEDDNLLSTATLAFGYAAACVTWILSLVFIGWTVWHRNDPVVRLSQMEYLIIICLGAVISSSTIVALSIQAGSDEDTEMATMACQAVPFLYTIGWVLQYGSLSAKSFRLYKVMNHPSMSRVKVTFWDTFTFLACILALDLIVVVTWTFTHPLEYDRKVTSVSVDDQANVMTISSYGSCSVIDGPSIWAFVGPIIAIHALLMVTTNIILYKLRNVADRYQEQKYIALGSVFVFEVLVVGLPVVVSVGANPMSVFMVLSGIIALNDIGMLCFVFLPKVKFQRKGVSDGIAVGETILKVSHKKATMRESVMRDASHCSAQNRQRIPPMSPTTGSRPGSEDTGHLSSHLSSSFQQAPCPGLRDGSSGETGPPRRSNSGDSIVAMEQYVGKNRCYDEAMLKVYSLEIDIEEAKERERDLQEKNQALAERVHLLEEQALLGESKADHV